MVFGVFDGLHEGHRFFLQQARKHGSLIIVVARDGAVQHLKNKTPRWDEDQRLAALRAFMPDATVILGDAQQGRYDVVKIHQPDMICLGYDQAYLADDLRRAMREGVIPRHELIKIMPKL